MGQQPLVSRIVVVGRRLVGRMIVDRMIAFEAEVQRMTGGTGRLELGSFGIEALRPGSLVDL